MTKAAVGHAVLYGRTKVGPEDVAFISRLAKDTIPSVRRKAMEAMSASQLNTTTQDLSRSLDLPSTTAERVRDDLLILKLIELKVEGKPNYYAPTRTVIDLLTPDKSGRFGPTNVGGVESKGLPPLEDLYQEALRGFRNDKWRPVSYEIRDLMLRHQLPEEVESDLEAIVQRARDEFDGKGPLTKGSVGGGP